MQLQKFKTGTLAAVQKSAYAIRDISYMSYTRCKPCSILLLMNQQRPMLYPLFFYVSNVSADFLTVSFNVELILA